MSMTTKNRKHNTGVLRAHELLTEEHAPWVAGARSFGISLPDGRLVEVVFSLPARGRGAAPAARIAPSMAMVAETIEQLAGMVS